MFKFQKDLAENPEFTREELKSILAGLHELSDDDLEKVCGGVHAGDEREEYTLDEKESHDDIWGSKFIG